MALVAAVTACGSSAEEGPSGPKLLTIGGGPGREDPAFNALLDVVRHRVPGIEITIHMGCSASRCTGEPPPDVFGLLGGQDLRQWAARGLDSIDPIVASEGWTQVFASEILQSFTGDDGHVYGAPLRIERDNTLFFNRDALRSAGVSPPTSVAEWFVAADALEAAGRTPLAVSATGGWTIAAHLFEGLLIAEAGPQFYLDYLRGAKTGDAPEIAQALTDLGKMMDYANADRALLGWGDAVKRVCDGEAAMIFLPDFVQGQFELQGCGPEQVGYVPLQPASAPSFVYVTAGWALTKGAPHREMGLEFLKAVASKAGQEAFVSGSGGVPPRTDLDVSRFSALTRQTVADLASPATTKTEGYSALTSSAFQEAVNPALQQFVDPSSPDHQNVATALARLQQSYATIRP